MINYRYVSKDTESNSFIIELDDYKGVYVKIEDIRFDEKTGEPTFQIQLPEGMTEYFKNEAFIEAVQDAVGDVIVKATRATWDEATAKALSILEERVIKAYEPYGFKPEEGKSFIQMFGEKGYVISLDENDRLLAMKVENGKTYYFDMNEQLSFLKKELTGKGIILQ
jgi:hypothetical protein